MTEKRFDVGNLKIQDNAPKGRVYLLDMQGGVNALCSLINGLNDKSNRLEKENEQLKSTINTITHDNTKMKKVLNTTKKENEHIKQLIKEAYNNERTKLGQSVLKQLMETIQ